MSCHLGLILLYFCIFYGICKSYIKNNNKENPYLRMHFMDDDVACVLKNTWKTTFEVLGFFWIAKVGLYKSQLLQ